MRGIGISAADRIDPGGAEGTGAGPSKKYYLQLFGGLRFGDGEAVLTQEQLRSDMVTKLATFLMYNYRNPLSVQGLIEALWPEGGTGNPEGALKNLVYRLRKALEKNWPDETFILTGAHTYQWNPELSLVIDTEEFEQRLHAADKSIDVNRKKELLLEGIRLYTAQLLPDFGNVYRILCEQTRLHNRFLSAIRELCSILEHREEYETMIEVCQKAARLEPFDVPIQVLLMKAYFGVQKYSLAEKHFQEACLFFEESGLTEEVLTLRSEYRRIQRQMNNMETSLRVIEQDLRQDPGSKRAFVVGYDVFRRVFELRVRRAERHPELLTLGLLTLNLSKENAGTYPVGSLSAFSGGMPGNASQIYTIREQEMDRMEGNLSTGLRGGDVITRYSANQFLMVFGGCSEHDAEQVLQRVVGLYGKSGGRCRCSHSVKAVEVSRPREAAETDNVKM